MSDVSDVSEEETSSYDETPDLSESSDDDNNTSDIMDFLGGSKNKELSEQISQKLQVSPPSLSSCNKIFTSNKTKVVKRNQPLFYNDKTQIVLTINEKDDTPSVIGVLLTVEYKNAPIIFDGNYCSVVKPLNYEEYLVQKCTLTNFVYYPNDDNQWVYVGTYDEKRKVIEWKTLNF